MGGLGNAYNKLGETRRAIEYYEQWVEIAREIGDRLGEANGLFNMSGSQNALGDRDAAVERMQRALAIYDAMEVPEADRARDRLAAWRGEL